LQSRVNGLARPVKRHGYLGRFFVGIQESIKLGVFIDSPSARPGFHFFAFGPAPDFRETPNLFAVPATLLGGRASSSAIALSDFDEAASCIKRRSSAKDHRVLVPTFAIMVLHPSSWARPELVPAGYSKSARRSSSRRSKKLPLTSSPQLPGSPAAS
jgi:hypothetical protein